MSGQGGRVRAAVAIMFRSGADGGRLAPMPTPMPSDWQRALVIAAHPDDIEYGLAAAVAVWTAAGKEVHYLLATRGEAGMAGVPPEEAGPLREEEERRSAAVVGVTEVEFLDHRDGVLVGRAGAAARPRGGDPPAPAGTRRHRVLRGDVDPARRLAGVRELRRPPGARAVGARRRRRRGQRVDLPGPRPSRPGAGCSTSPCAEMLDPPHEVDVSDHGGEGGRVADRAPPLPRVALGHPGRGAGTSGCRHVDVDGGRAAPGGLPALLGLSGADRARRAASAQAERSARRPASRRAGRRRTAGNPLPGRPIATSTLGTDDHERPVPAPAARAAPRERRRRTAPAWAAR